MSASGVSSCVLQKSLAAKKSPYGHTKVCDRVDFVCASCMHRDIRECIVYPSGVIGSAPRLLRVFIGGKLKFTLTFRFRGYVRPKLEIDASCILRESTSGQCKGSLRQEPQSGPLKL